MDVFTTRQVEELRNELLAAAVNCTFVADENCTPGTPLCSAKSRSSVDFAWALRPAIRGPVETASGTRFDIRSRLGGHLHGDDPPAQDDCKAHGPWPGRKHRH